MQSADVTPDGKMKLMRVRDGRAERLYEATSDAFFYLQMVAATDFGDLAGDGREEAAVTAIYGSYSASFFLTDTYVFGCMNNRVKLISILKQKRIEKESGLVLQESVKKPLQIKRGVLYITYGTGGSRPSPEFITTFGYKIIKNKLVAYKRPRSRKNY